MNVNELIKKLNDEVVTFVTPDSNKKMTLNIRLANTCEEGFLVSGKELNGADLKDKKNTLLEDVRYYLKVNKLKKFDADTVYCWSNSELYRVGKTYQECIQELSQGHISQLSDTSENTWVTLLGNYPNARLDDDFTVIGLA